MIGVEFQEACSRLGYGLRTAKLFGGDLRMKEIRLAEGVIALYSSQAKRSEVLCFNVTLVGQRGEQLEKRLLELMSKVVSRLEMPYASDSGTHKPSAHNQRKPAINLEGIQQRISLFPKARRSIELLGTWLDHWLL